jgi:Uma2 family endonuclease
VATTILDIPDVRERVSRLSVEEYHRLGEFNENGRRTELIRGIVIEKMSKSPLHSTLVALLYQILLRRVPKGFVIRQEQPLTFQDSEPEPDIAIVAGTERDYLQSHPCTAELVIEVSLANPALDRANASLYAEANVKDYWIILGKDREVEVYRRPENGCYQERVLTDFDGVLQCSPPGLRLQLSELFL